MFCTSRQHVELKPNTTYVHVLCTKETVGRTRIKNLTPESGINDNVLIPKCKIFHFVHGASFSHHAVKTSPEHREAT